MEEIRLEEVRDVMWDRLNNVSESELAPAPDGAISFSDIVTIKKYAVASIEEIGVRGLKGRYTASIIQAMNLVNDDKISRKVCKPQFKMFDELYCKVKSYHPGDKPVKSKEEKVRYIEQLLNIVSLMDLYHVFFKLSFLRSENYTEHLDVGIMLAIDLLISRWSLGSISVENLDPGTLKIVQDYISNLKKIDHRFKNRVQKPRKDLNLLMNNIAGFELISSLTILSLESNLIGIINGPNG